MYGMGTMRWTRIALAAALPALAWGAELPSTDRVRTAAEKGLALIQASQNTWYAKQSCESCHHQVLPELAYKAAREHGLRFDEAAARVHAAKAFSGYANLDRAVQYTQIIDPVVDDTWKLLAANAAGVRPNLVTAVYARLHMLHQRPGGYWTTLDVRPPASHSTFSATAISVRAIQLYGHPSQAANTQACIGRARKWLEHAVPANTEDRSFQLFGLTWAGADRTALASRARSLAAA